MGDGVAVLTGGGGPACCNVVGDIVRCCGVDDGAAAGVLSRENKHSLVTSHCFLYVPARIINFDTTCFDFRQAFGGRVYILFSRKVFKFIFLPSTRKNPSKRLN